VRSCSPSPFDGYPYLVTRIGRTALRNVAILPVDWSRERAVDLARRQAAINQLETCLCLGPTDAVYVSPDGETTTAQMTPVGIPVVEKLALAEPIAETTELTARRARLIAFAASLTPDGYLVGDGLEGGHPASQDEINHLSGQSADGVPIGLDRCATCVGFRGDYLAVAGEGNGDTMPRVVRVHCRCENHNRCAACFQPLAETRLSAYGYDEANGSVHYLAAYVALSHQCRAGRLGRPCLECGEPVNWDDDWELHLHETGLPGRMWRAAQRGQRGNPTATREAARPAEEEVG
jgi:hypothetical protein